MRDKIRVLFLGDIIGRPGRRILSRHLEELRKELRPDVIIANAENAAGGVGLTVEVAQELLSMVNVLTSGNHIWDKKEGIPFLENEPRVLRPANYPPGNPGRGDYLFFLEDELPVAVLNLQGRVFMEPIDCPFRVADEIVERLRKKTPIIVVDFHAEATSEKQALGWYLDGRVSAVVGTHTHVPTADERILPKGTAFITDVGMVGARNSVIGIRSDQALARFLTGRPQRFEPAKQGSILSAFWVEIETQSGLATAIKRLLITEDTKQDE